MKRIFAILFSVLPVLFGGCSQEEDTLSDQREKLVSYLEGSHSPSLVADTSLEAGSQLPYYTVAGNTAYRYIKNVYDPDPVPELPVRHAEDPAVFLETMRHLSKSTSITELDEPYRESDKHLGAWRKISGVLYWVIPEAKWAAAYRKAIRALPDVDTAFFAQKSWIRDLQRILVDEGSIKRPSSGARYRFDLYGTGKRDSTYVIAIPADVLSGS